MAKKRWRLEDTQVLREGPNGEVRHLRLPNGRMVSIRMETLAEMVVTTMQELQTTPTRMGELRLAVLRRMCDDEEWEIAAKIVGEVVPVKTPDTVEELLAAIDGGDLIG